MAANDQLIVFARNRDDAFHFIFNPPEATMLTRDLPFDSVLAISTQTSSLDEIDLVFIGGTRNSLERTLCHV